MTVRAIPTYRFKDPEVQKAFDALREALQEGNGERGNPQNKWLTVGDATDGTVTKIISGSGNGNGNGNGSGNVAPAVLLTASKTNPLAGEHITLTVTLTGGASPTGSITFQDGGVNLKNVTIVKTQLSTDASFLKGGAHSLKALYSGDANNAPSQSPELIITVDDTNVIGPPPAPTSLTLYPASFSITAVWTNPVIADLQATEVWALRSFSAWNSTYIYQANAKVLVGGVVYRSRQVQNINHAVTDTTWWEATTLAPTAKAKVGESAGLSFEHTGLTPGETWTYWVRNRDTTNLFSDYFPNDDVGITTTTTLDPTAYLTLLTGAITETQLYSDLGAKITLIPQMSTDISTLNTGFSNIKDGSTDLTVVSNGTTTTLRAIKTSSQNSASGIIDINTVTSTSNSANARALAGVTSKFDIPDGKTVQSWVVDDRNTWASPSGTLGQRLSGIDSSITQKSKTTFGSGTPSSTPPSGQTYTNGDLYFQTDSTPANRAYRWNGSSWVDYSTGGHTFTGSGAPQIGTRPASGTTLVSGDLYIDTSADSTTGVSKNDVYRYNGYSWDNVGTSTLVNARVSNLETTKIGYCTIGGVATDYTSKSACESAGGTWNQGIPMSTAVKQVSVTTQSKCFLNGSLVDGYTQSSCQATTGSDGKLGVWMPGGTAALEQKFQAQQDATGPLYASYTLKIDTNGWVSGFGLANTQQTDGKVISDFGIRADRFWLAPPTNPGNAVGGPGIGLVDISGNGTGVVLRITNTTLQNPDGSRFIAYFAYIQLAEYPGNYGLTYLNPFSGDATPQTRQWISLTNIRDSLSGSRSSFWNQAFPAQGVGNYSWKDYTYGYERNLTVEQLPGVTTASNVVVISSFIGAGTPQGYTTNVTDPTQANSDPAKLIPPSLLPFIVTSTAQSYNGTSIPAGVYINNAYMANAMMGRATLTGKIGSDNYVASASGWQIESSGAAEFNGAKFRGEVTSTVAGSPTFDSAGNVTSTGWAGWGIGRNGDAIFNTVVIRDGTQIGTNALVQAATVVDVAYANNQSVYTNTTNGTTDRFASNYTPKTAASKTAGFFFGLDLDIAANYTTKVVVTFSGAFNYVWIAYYKGGSVLSSRQLSATTTYNGTLTGQPLYTKVTATNNGAGGTWGDIKLSILEITG